MLLTAMSVDTYGLDEDRYLEIFEDKATFLFKTMRALIRVSLEENVNLDGWPHDIIWKMYESVTYDTNDAARVIQKTEAPEKIEERSYDLIPMYTSQDLMDEIKSVDAKVEGLADYLAELVKVTTNGLDGIAETLVD
jgi:hypothetical protein